MTDSARQQSSFVAVPKEYVTSPIFAAKPTTQSRTVYLSDGTRYTIGGNLLDTGKQAPALDIRHLRLLLVLLFFRQKNFPPPAKITFSMNDACHQYASSQGGRYSRDLMRLFEDLKNSCFEIQRAGDKDFFIYPILKDFRIRGKYQRRKPKSEKMQKELHLEYAELHEDFIPILMEAVHFDLETFKKFTSPIAQAIYIFIPSRSPQRKQENPFSIDLKTLLREIGAAVPAAKWERKKLFTQNKNSILSQLNGAPTRTGILKARIEETATKEDYQILFWEDTVPTKPSPPSLKSQKTGVFGEIWLRGGGSKEEFRHKISSQTTLTKHELGLIAQSRIRLDGNKKAFILAKSLIGRNSFLSCLTKTNRKNSVPNTTIKGQTSRFIYFLKEEIMKTPKG